MPQFGSYTDGGVGAINDEILVKRTGTGTLRLPLDKLPVPESVAAAYVNQNAFNTYQENTDAAIQSKENVLTFQQTIGGAVSRVGNTVSIPSLANVVGDLFDGKAFAMLPSSSTSMTSLGANVSTGSNIGTFAPLGPNNPTNNWNYRGRTTITSAATASSHSRLTFQPKVRFPETTTSAYGGFRVVFTWASKDAVTAVGFVGLNQTNITAGTAPSAYTGSRFGVMFDPALTGADYNLKLCNGGTIIQDFGAGFPGNGNESNAYMLDLWVRPFPNYGCTYTITNLVSGATATGTTTNIPLGVFDPFVTMVRDNQATATAVVLSTCGVAGGAYSSFVVGDNSSLIPTPNTLTTGTTLTKISHADRDNFVNSASPVTLTVDNTGFNTTGGEYLYGTNIGLGAVSFAGASGVTINKHTDVPTTVAQYQSFSLVHLGSNVWVRIS